MEDCVDFPSVGQFLAVLEFDRSEPRFERRDKIVHSFSHGAVKMFWLIDRVNTGFASRCAEGVGEHTHEFLRRGSGWRGAGLSLSRKFVYLLLHVLDGLHHVGWSRRLVSGSSTIGGTRMIDVGHADRSFEVYFGLVVVDSLRYQLWFRYWVTVGFRRGLRQLARLLGELEPGIASITLE